MKRYFVELAPEQDDPDKERRTIEVANYKLGLYGLLCVVLLRSEKDAEEAIRRDVVYAPGEWLSFEIVRSLDDDDVRGAPVPAAVIQKTEYAAERLASASE